MSPDDDSPWPTLADLQVDEWVRRFAEGDDEAYSEPVADPEARVHIDRSRLTKATPLTLRPKPVEHLAPDTIDDDRERAADWHLEPDEMAF